MNMKALVLALVVGLVLPAEPAAAQGRGFYPELQGQERRMHMQPPERGQREPREWRRERRAAPDGTERPRRRMTDEERRELRRDIDQADREIYRRSRKQ
ncbi:MAG: hypothetical protein KIT18_03225 [Burkholderiales bacterium]|nr:hypothetical protein [Burkholderiales bacterium]